MIAGYDAKHIRGRRSCRRRKSRSSSIPSPNGLHRRHQLVPQHVAQLAALAAIDHTVRVPSLMIMAENDHVLPPSSADALEKIIPDLEKYLVAAAAIGRSRKSRTKSAPS